MNTYLEVLKKYAVFTGRARRKEYWMYFLVNFVISLVLSFIGEAIRMPDVAFGISLLYVLATLLPGLGVSVRRLHDTGRSGWWLLIGLVPFVGAIVLLIFLALEGTKGPNKYGADPKDVPVTM